MTDMPASERRSTPGRHRTWLVRLADNRTFRVTGTKAVVSSSGALVILGDGQGHHPRHVFKAWVELHDVRAIGQCCERVGSEGDGGAGR
jgi:hypothetical protein